MASLARTAKGLLLLELLSGMAVTWQQGRWSTPVRVFPGGYSATVAVSCAPGICMAVDSKGEAARN